jgi:hypothetical protein
MNRLKKTIKALRDLGLKKLWLYALYQLGLRSGHYRRAIPAERSRFDGDAGLPPCQEFPTPPKNQQSAALEAARRIGAGQVEIFGACQMAFKPESGGERHWTHYEGRSTSDDVKWTWEPGRFGWALTLARAYAFRREESFAATFWQQTRAFLDANPPNLGRHWQSAQEVALRLMVLIFCDRVFASADASTPANRQRLLQAIAEHARRIPPTLMYARAQNNNHLLSEAAGLYAAALYLPTHPRAGVWRRTGWRWLNWGFQHQISREGTYIQHSVNYHRLMLQLALFCDHLRREAGAADWPAATRQRLAAATRWLWALTDPQTGRVPNLGANDGAYIFPLTSRPFEDFRPVLDAAAKGFLNQGLFDQPALSEMAAWWGLSAPRAETIRQPQAPDMLRLQGNPGRAFLRTARFEDRPSHADQLHADLWWRGVNVARDPGTYSYNAPSPWDNALATARVHNTLTLDGRDQMQRAGRFLWLDWAQGRTLSREVDSEGRLVGVQAEHSGYRRLGAVHRRSMAARPDGWLVTDQVVPAGRPGPQQHTARVRWLLPDWPWTVEDSACLVLRGPDFSLRLTLGDVHALNIFRAGACVWGQADPEPVWGWFSPTYGVREPALLVVGALHGPLPLLIRSCWQIVPG